MRCHLVVMAGTTVASHHFSGCGYGVDHYQEDRGNYLITTRVAMR